MPAFAQSNLTASFLLEFPTRVEKVRHWAAQAEEAFAQIISAQSQQTNIADNADPTQPRIILADNTKRILITQMACQLDMKFDGSPPTLGKQFDVVERAFQQFIAAAVGKFTMSDFAKAGAVIVVNRSAKSSTIQEIDKYLADRFNSNPLLPNAISYKFAVGMQRDQHFVNFGAEAYESRRFKILNLKPGEERTVNPMDMPVVDRGLAFRIDVNNGPIAIDSSHRVDSTGDGVVPQLAKFFRTEFSAITEIPL